MFFKLFFWSGKDYLFKTFLNPEFDVLIYILLLIIFNIIIIKKILLNSLFVKYNIKEVTKMF